MFKINAADKDEVIKMYLVLIVMCSFACLTMKSLFGVTVLQVSGAQPGSESKWKENNFMETFLGY